MSVGGEVLLDVGSRSAWARPADMTRGGWLVVLGTGKCVEDFDTLQQVLVPESRR
jgi:hypothetical protein